MKIKRVTKVETFEYEPVYDLTVDGTENFCLANGAVAHNSKDLADSLAGCYQNLVRRRNLWNHPDYYSPLDQDEPDTNNNKPSSVSPPATNTRRGKKRRAVVRR